MDFFSKMAITHPLSFSAWGLWLLVQEPPAVHLLFVRYKK